ncbi:rho GTPase-activating protein 27 isoform X1 [Bufo gargarizans]|uniref:rho GTPase-activating protein 27 isoform X1 n=1 Tax=Bufo gargarizans TaxID=30331 RepID=UPI001CF4C136|nr:rho GTPase-activating protein 27 isoform X1 [Bufo gargarizans]XP_044152713.1 rho GTPase-activating protein 27 isoform X1 [Bufo gargarizans]XP_044152714.1 rho GTPase-activating protein 27 isoform X1 [Bufo gargarizans]XP_044152715.1 rho GTPase-activating protein 27 isoform X1 [Bufo gargarizans]
MQTAGTLDKDYVLVEHGFEYAAKDGSIISIKPHERYILLKRTNEHWWQVCRDHKSKPFYIPAKYVKVLSSIGQGSYGTDISWGRSEDLPEYSPCTQYSYSFVAVEPHNTVTIPQLSSGAQERAALSSQHLVNTASTGNVHLQSLVATGSSRSLLDLSQLRHNTAMEQRTSQDSINTDHKLGPLRTFHNSKKVLDPLKRISLMCPPDLPPRIRTSQSLNDLQLIKSVQPCSDQSPLKISENQLLFEKLTIQQSNVVVSETPEKVVNEEDALSPIYANLEDFRSEEPRQRTFSLERYSSSTIEDWETHTDKGSGQAFYYNCATGETTWDCPFDQAEEALQSPISPTSLSPLPGEAEWEKHFDESSGEFYFYNSVTGETSWEPPESELHLPVEKPMFSPYESVERRPPTPEADYPEYSDTIYKYPDADYDGHYIPPPPQQSPADGQFSGWSCQIKDGQKLYINNYSGDKWVQSQDQFGKTYFYTSDGSMSQWKLPELSSAELQSGNSDLDQNSNVFTGSQNNIASFSLQKDTEEKGLEKAGVLHKAKISENGRRLRKNWSSSWTVLEGGILTFFKDLKNLSSNIQKQSQFTVPEYTVRLQGASLRWAAKEKSSKKHVMELRTRDGYEYLIHHDSEAITKDWFASISKSIGRNMHISSDYTSENENESLSEFGSTEKLGMKDEKKNSGQNSDSDRNVRAKLRKLLQRRPTLQSLRDKGYIRDQVFGCHLHQLCEREKRDVPEFVSHSIEVVEKRGLDIDGLYRISGNLAVIQKLRYKVDHDENFSLDDGRWEDVHVITGALKLFFRELPEPLFPYSHFDQFIEAIKFSDQSQKIQRLKELVLSLPKPNLETMKLLFRHLCSVIQHKDSNRMSVQSVAIVFGPTLLRSEQEGINIAMYMVYQNQIVEQILVNYKFIFS